MTVIHAVNKGTFCRDSCLARISIYEFVYTVPVAIYLLFTHTSTPRCRNLSLFQEVEVDALLLGKPTLKRTVKSFLLLSPSSCWDGQTKHIERVHVCVNSTRPVEDYQHIVI